MSLATNSARSRNLLVCRWDDGQPVVRQLTQPDRWEVHSADVVHITLGCFDQLTVVQKPKSLSALQIGVGACVWDGALLLAGYLAYQPQYRFLGAKCVELGAGVGFVSTVLAKLGSQVIATDIAKVIPLLEENLKANNVLRSPTSAGGWVVAQELEWGKPGWLKEQVKLVNHPPPDFVLAADCCYVDNEGKSPSTLAFIQTCVALCGPKTTILVAFERRSSEVRRCFVDLAKSSFLHCQMIPLTKLPPPLRLEYCDLWELKNPV